MNGNDLAIHSCGSGGISGITKEVPSIFYKFDNSSMSSLLGHIPWESNILGESVPMFEKHHSVGSFGGGAQLLTW